MDTATLPGATAVDVNPAQSSFIQGALAAAGVNVKPDSGGIQSAPAPDKQGTPAKAQETPKAASSDAGKADAKDETKKAPKVNVRRIAAGEETPEVQETPEAKPDDADKGKDEVPAGIRSTKAADEFRKIKAERDALKAELAAAKAKPAGDDGTKTLLEQITKERDEYSSRLRELDIERHPEFQTKYGKRIEGLEASIKSVAGAEGDKLVKLLALPDSDYKATQIDAIVEGLNPGQRTKLGGFLAAHEMALTERKAELESAKGNWEQRLAAQRLEEEKAKAREVEDVEENWNAALLSAGELEPFQIDDADPESAPFVAKLVEQAKGIYMGLNSNQALARAAIAAAAVNPLREALYASLEQQSRLQAEIKKLKGATPSAGKQSPNNGAAKPKGFIETALASVGR